MLAQSPLLSTTIDLDLNSRHLKARLPIGFA